MIKIVESLPHAKRLPLGMAITAQTITLP